MDLQRLNSATKYPSIETYHRLEKGKLQPEVQVPLDGEIVVTEKVDGTNSRIIVFPGGFGPEHRHYIIGSREDLLHAQGDLIINPTLSIVETIRDIADRCPRWSDGINAPQLLVLYGETYGGNGITQASRFYSKTGKAGFRLFDAIEMPWVDFLGVMKMERPKIASWRDHGGQPFVTEDRLHRLATQLGIEVTPRITASAPPMGVKETHEWLKNVLRDGSKAILDEQGKGKPEGVVVRTHDRSKIAKIRFEDYEKAER